MKRISNYKLISVCNFTRNMSQQNSFGILIIKIGLYSVFEEVIFTDTAVNCPMYNDQYAA